MKKCQLLIFEEQLYDGKSHHLAYYESILSAARRSGNEVALYANREVEEFVCRRLNAIPALWTMAGFVASGPRRVANSFYRFVFLANNLLRNVAVCTSALKRHEPDVALCLSTWIPHVVLFLLVSLKMGRSMPTLVLLFVWYPRIGKAKPRAFRLVRFFVRWLLKVHPQTYIFAETRYAQRAWEEFLGVPVSYVVHPVEVVNPTEENADKRKAEILKRRDADCSALDTSAPAKRVVFGFYGFARHEQGVDVLMRALEILKNQGQFNAEFRIAWPKPFQMPDGSWMDREMFGHLGANVRFYENPLSPDEYLQALADTDWLILPYRVASYEGRCSRISIEACVMGIPVIYTQNTDLEKVVYEFGSGIPVCEEQPEDLVAAIRMAVTENLLWQIKALEKRIAAQLYFSGQSFVKEVTSLLGLKKLS